MKKSLSIILILVLVASLFTGCDKDKKPTPESKIELTSEYDKSTELVGDPSATGELNISVYERVSVLNGSGPDQLTAAIEKFKVLYPGIILNVDKVSGDYPHDRYVKELWNDVNQGKGPDLFIAEDFTQIANAVHSGSLADMSEYFKNDTTFQAEEYSNALLSSIESKAYTIPLGYTIPLLFSTNTMIKESGFNINQCSDFYSTVDELTILSNKYQKSSSITTPIAGYSSINYPIGAGLDFIDYDTHTIRLNNSRIKKYMELNTELGKKTKFDTYAEEWIKELKQKKSVIVQKENNLSTMSQTLLVLGNDSVCFPMRDVNGSIKASVPYQIAVSNSCQNKQNAYYFIKVMLSKEVQYCQEFPESLKMYIPVCNAAAKQYLTDSLLPEGSLKFGEDPKKSKKQNIIFINQFLEYLSEVDGTEGDIKISILFSEAMQPYYKDQKSYEECIADAEKKIQAYVFG